MLRLEPLNQRTNETEDRIVLSVSPPRNKRFRLVRRHWWLISAHPPRKSQSCRPWVGRRRGRRPPLRPTIQYRRAPHIRRYRSLLAPASPNEGLDAGWSLLRPWSTPLPQARLLTRTGTCSCSWSLRSASSARASAPARVCPATARLRLVCARRRSSSRVSRRRSATPRSSNHP